MGRARLTAEERAERENDPSATTRYFYRHPWRAGAGSGLALSAWCFRLDLPWWVVAATGLVMAIVVGMTWRPGGVGQGLRRYVRRRFPKQTR